MKPIFENLENDIEKQNKLKLDIYQKKIIRDIKSLLPKGSYFEPIKNLFNKKTGIYLYGPSGIGKTMILDTTNRIFSSRKSIKTHFSEFIYQLQKINLSSEAILKTELEKNKIFFKNQVLICIDELNINNLADVIILEKFLIQAKKSKIFTFFTSNWAPEKLYTNNHQKEKITNFVNFLKKNLSILKLETKKDYRKQHKKCSFFLFETRLKNNLKKMRILKRELVGNIVKKEKRYVRPGNAFSFKNVYKDLLECEFDEICGSNLGFEDYKLISKHIHFFFIKNVPAFDKSMNDKTKRFISLIDVIYEDKKILSISTKFNFVNLDLKKNNIEFQRTISRLSEIFSKKYINENLQKFKKLYYI